MKKILSFSILSPYHKIQQLMYPSEKLVSILLSDALNARSKINFYFKISLKYLGQLHGGISIPVFPFDGVWQRRKESGSTNDDGIWHPLMYQIFLHSFPKSIKL